MYDFIMELINNLNASDFYLDIVNRDGEKEIQIDLIDFIGFDETYEPIYRYYTDEDAVENLRETLEETAESVKYSLLWQVYYYPDFSVRVGYTSADM